MSSLFAPEDVGVGAACAGVEAVASVVWARAGVAIIAAEIRHADRLVVESRVLVNTTGSLLFFPDASAVTAL